MSKEQIIEVMSSHELRDFFSDKLPEDYPQSWLNYTSCIGLARLIVLHFNGPDFAQIWWVGEEDDGEYDQNADNHAYVVLKNQIGIDMAYNNDPQSPIRTVEYVLENGKNITQEVFSYQWTEI